MCGRIWTPPFCNALIRVPPSIDTLDIITLRVPLGSLCSCCYSYDNKHTLPFRLSSPQIMYHFSIEFLELAVSCLGLGEGGCDCTALAMH